MPSLPVHSAVGSLAQSLAARWFPIAWHRRRFVSKHGYEPDLNTPVRFSEKLAHRILFEDDPLYALYANKCFAPYYAKAKVPDGLKFAVRYGVFKSMSAGDFDPFPDRFVVKLSHGSGANEIVMNKRAIDRGVLTRRFNRALRTTRNAQHRRDPNAAIIVEEFLADDDGGIPDDYKFHCFNNPGAGEFACVFQVDMDRFGQHHRNFYDAGLNQIDLRWADATPIEGAFELPDNIDSMLTMAKRLSVDFDYIRVDLYSIRGEIYFSEFTPFHQGGGAKVLPAEWDERLGKMWTFSPARRRSHHGV